MALRSRLDHDSAERRVCVQQLPGCKNLGGGVMRLGAFRFKGFLRLALA